MGRQLGAEVHVVTVHDVKESESDQSGLDELRTLLEMRTCGTVKADDVALRCHALTGEPAEAIVSMARNIDAPLIVCGTTGKGTVARTLLGSVSHELVHKSGAIVMSVP